MTQKNNTKENIYLVNIVYLNSNISPIEIKIISDNLEFTMDQYQRNRDPFKWKYKIIKEL